jgi:hypothetical protein
MVFDKMTVKFINSQKMSLQVHELSGNLAIIRIRQSLVMVIALMVLPIHYIYADVINETLLLTCQASGATLYNQCVIKEPVTPQQITACTALKISYILCLGQLNLPYPLVRSLDPDPYAYSPFTPCEYETGHLVLPEICPSI